MKEAQRYEMEARQMRRRLRDRVFNYALENKYRLKWKKAAYALAYGASVYEIGRDFLIQKDKSK
jgi:hypothetical protein